jgi:hypothetical protein
MPNDAKPENAPRVFVIVPFAVQLEHDIDGPLRRRRNLVERVRVAVPHRSVRHRRCRQRGMLLGGRRVADEAIGEGGVVEETVAQLGVLRAASGKHAEHVGVERPGAEALRECRAEQHVP